MDLFTLLPFLVASPFVFASMIRKIVHDEKPTAECLYFSIGIAVIYLVLIFMS